jgi:RNA polymerase sigma-70 factor (ECF subfamily)
LLHPGLEAPAQAPSTAALFGEHAPYVWRALRRLGVHESDVEDVCQEVFVVVHRKRAGFEGRSSPRTWIYGICVRTASDYRKRASHRREAVTDHPPEELSRDDPHDAASVRQACDLLDRLLAGLDEDKRAVFVLYEIEELSMKEVADALDCPLQTAYSRLHAARAKITEEAQRLRDTGGPYES